MSEQFGAGNWVGVPEGIVQFVVVEFRRRETYEDRVFLVVFNDVGEILDGVVVDQKDRVQSARDENLSGGLKRAEYLVFVDIETETVQTLVEDTFRLLRCVRNEFYRRFSLPQTIIIIIPVLVRDLL